ncbi:hypothetical protein ACWDSL_36060 [Streptomyces sp. NPDC000941]
MLPQPFRTAREIVRNKNTVSVIAKITGPIPRDEAPNLGPMQLMHTQSCVQAVALRIGSVYVLAKFEPRVSLEVAAADHAYSRLHGLLILTLRQQVLQQHVTVAEALLSGVDIQGEHMGDGTVGPVQAVRRVEVHGEDVLNIADALRVDNTPHHPLGFDDELALSVE